MKRILDNLHYVLVGIITIFTAVIPIIRYLVIVYKNLRLYPDMSRLTVLDMWDNLNVSDGNLFFFISPFAILILVIYELEKMQINIFEFKSYFRVLLKPVYYLIGYSLLLLVISIIVPTEGFQSTRYTITQYVFSNINLVMFSLFISCLGFIIARCVKKTSLRILGSFALYLFVMLGLYLVGGVLENVISGGFNADWLFIYNVIWFDSGTTIVFSTLYMLVLLNLGGGVTYLTYKDID
jgi:hypothetical protein